MMVLNMFVKNNRHLAYIFHYYFVDYLNTIEMEKKYRIEKIVPLPNEVVDSIIQIWLSNSQETLFVEDRGGLTEMLNKYGIKNQERNIYDCTHLIGRKCEIEFDNFLQVKSFNYC